MEPAVTLDKYLIELGRDHILAPEKLELPDSLVTLLDALSVSSETDGVEHGCQLMFDSDARTFANEPIAAGSATSVDIPASTNPQNFGDAHGHPTTALGYRGGFPAHSPRDLMKFAATADRPYFFQFVACGPWHYLVVQVRHLSYWGDRVLSFLNVRRNVEAHRMRQVVFAAAGGEENFEKLTAGLEDENEVRRVERELGPKGGLGRVTQSVTRECCTLFAGKYGYFFYMGERDVLTIVG